MTHDGQGAGEQTCRNGGSCGTLLQAVIKFLHRPQWANLDAPFPLVYLAICSNKTLFGRHQSPAGGVPSFRNPQRLRIHDMRLAENQGYLS